MSTKISNFVFLYYGEQFLNNNSKLIKIQNSMVIRKCDEENQTDEENDD